MKGLFRNTCISFGCDYFSFNVFKTRVVENLVFRFLVKTSSSEIQYPSHTVEIDQFQLDPLYTVEIVYIVGNVSQVHDSW